MKTPVVPRILVGLGRAVKVDGDEWIWTWNTRDDWIVTSNDSGTRLYLFKCPKTTKPTRSASIRKGSALYRVFNHSDSDEILGGSVVNIQRKAGKARSIIYESDKFGKKQKYIHEFDTWPIVWTDRPSKPRIMALTGGKIRITKRGIEG